MIVACVLKMGTLKRSRLLWPLRGCADEAAGPKNKHGEGVESKGFICEKVKYFPYK